MKVKTSFTCHCGECVTGMLTINNNGVKYTQDHYGTYGSGYWDGNEDTMWIFVIGAVFGSQYIKYKTPEYSHSIGEYTAYDPVVIDMTLNSSTITYQGKTLTFDVGYTESESLHNESFRELAFEVLELHNIDLKLKGAIK